VLWIHCNHIYHRPKLKPHNVVDADQNDDLDRSAVFENATTDVEIFCFIIIGVDGDPTVAWGSRS